MKVHDKFIINNFIYEITALSHTLTNRSVTIITLMCNDDKCERRKMELYYKNYEYLKFIKNS
jgi:hypothetical protein